MGDYGVMIFADQRYARQDKRSKIPDWIRNFIEPGHLVMATDVAVDTTRNFLLRMSQPFKAQTGIGASVMSPSALAALQEREAAMAAELRNEAHELLPPVGVETAEEAKKRKQSLEKTE